MSRRSPPPVGLATRHVASRVDQRADPEHRKRERDVGITGRSSTAARTSTRPPPTGATSTRDAAPAGSSASRRRARSNRAWRSGRSPAATPIRSVTTRYRVRARPSTRTRSFSGSPPWFQARSASSWFRLQELRRAEDLPRVAVAGIPIDSRSRQRHGVGRSPLQQAQPGQLAQRRGRSRTGESARRRSGVPRRSEVASARRLRRLQLQRDRQASGVVGSRLCGDP